MWDSRGDLGFLQMVAQKNPHICESVRDEHLSDMIVTQPEDWILMEEEL